MRHICLLAGALLLWVVAYGQSYSFTEFNSSNGLPQSQVQCITQDDEGYLWVGTLGGLARFNGKTFQIYSVNEGLLSNRITALSFIDGKLLIGHEGGVSILENKRVRKYRFNGSDLDSRTTDVVKFKNHFVFSTYQGQLYTLNQKGVLQRVQHKRLTEFRGIYDLEIINDQLCLATNEGVVRTSDLVHFNGLKQLSGLDISGFSRRSDGKIWVSTYEKGIFLCTPSFQLIDSIDLIKYFGIERAFIDSQDNLWLNSFNGVTLIKKGKQKILFDAKNGLPIYSMRCTYEDRDGTIWFGSDGKGLLRFSGERILHYRIADGLPSEQLLSLHKLKDGTFLFGSYENGLHRSNRNGGYTKIPLNRSCIWDIESDRLGNIWCGTEKGVAVYRPSGKIEYYTIGRVTDRVAAVKRIKNKIYLGGVSGLGIVENGTFREIKLSESEKSKLGVVKSFVLYQGRILCAGTKGIFDISGNHPKQFLNFRNGVVSMSVDYANHLWVGTENGLYLLRDNRFEMHKIAGDPASNTINFIECVQNNCFIGTNNGLYVVNSLSLSVEHHYGLNDGLINLECNVNSSLFDGRNLWFGTAEGLIRFDHGLKNDREKLPPMLNVSSILVNYNSFNYEDYATGMGKNGIPTGIRLPYSMNNITIELDGISLSNPDALRYRFWLEGEDETWSKPSANSTITLSNVPDGNHVLHMRVTDAYGNTSATILFPISITPPFWRTWWFYGSIVLLIILALRAYFRWKIRQERERNYKKNLEYKTRLLALEQQSLNASMNRHFIFNSLNSIQYFINTQDRISANRYLTNFAKLIRKNLDSAVEAENMVTLQQEIERLELYLSLEAMRFKDRFTYTINDHGIDTEAIVVPGMLLQPFVENSIIHGILPNESIKGHIAVNVCRTNDHLEITIDDNGIGIDFSLQQKQMMSGDHKSQGMEITSKRIDIIRELSKKDFDLEGPFQLFNPDGSIQGTRVLLKIPLENLED